ncbi:hypothetical protein ACTXLA_13190, partial [Psychrobacter celer]
GTIMNTAVGIMQTEQVGRIKKTFVGKSYSITAGDEFKITVGKSSLVMNADGSIIITGSSIITQAEGENKVIGKDVLINPPGASAGGTREELEPDYLNDAPAEIGPDGLPILGSDSGLGDGLSGFGNYTPNPYDKPPKGYKYVWDEGIRDMVLKPIPDKKSNFAVDPIALAFPTAARHMATDPKVRAQARLQNDMRNVTYAGAAIAGYGPYIGAAAKEAATLLPQTAINGASSGGALGGVSYVATTPSEEWDPGKALIYTTGGALTGGVGGIVTTAAGVAAAGASGTYLTQFAAEGEADLFTAGVNGLSGGVLKPYNLGVAGDIAQTATTSAAGEFGKSVEFQDSDSTDDLGLFWTKKP